MSLKDIPLQLKIDSEEDLRSMVYSYCCELGFEADEISCEDYFSITLGHNAIGIDKKMIGGRSDILISRNGKPLAIIETKNISHSLTDEDAKQAISYARLLSNIAPFAIVTNGVDTRVYDVLAGELCRVDNPQDSIWSKNGQQISVGISDELRYEATKVLIALNPDTLSQFCEQQIITRLSDLKSDVKSSKKYNPELYVKRESLNKAFTEWEQGESPVFAIIAPSGYGKTNFMCAKCEEMSSSHFALFYSAGRFTNGLAHAIKDDFIWEFHRDRETFQVFERLDTIARSAGKKILVFVDAIDENPVGIKAIKNELLDIIAKLRKYQNIRLVFSCKLFDWPYVITDGNQSFNLLAEAINPACAHPETRSTSPDSGRIGFHFAEFTNEELREAITKYKSAYSVEGEFYGELLEESRNPLMLRFISEIYGGGREKLPTSISRPELFTLYLQRKLEPIENQNLAEIILTKIASLVFTSGIRYVPKDQIISILPWSESYDRVLQNLFRLGILSKTYADEIENIGFEFNKFLLYFYVFKTKKFHALSLEQQVVLAQELIKTSIGIEALDFYLVAVSQDVAHKFLLEIASWDFPLLALIINGLKGMETYKKTPIPLDHIFHYLDFYNFLKGKFFTELSHAIMPYVKMPLGVIFIEGTPVKFRACTPVYPHPFIDVEDKDNIKKIFSGPVDLQMAQTLMPVGSFHLGGIHEFTEYPQKASYDHLMREISSALSNRLLNESVSRDILLDRIYEILLYHPSSWLVENGLPREHYWKLLGYVTIEELENSKVSELKERVSNLIKDFSKYLKKRDNLSPSYYHRLNELCMALFSMSQMDDADRLGSRRYSLDKLLGTRSGAIKPDSNEVKNVISIIIENYKLLFAANFPLLTTYSPFFKNIDNLSVVEILHDTSSDFPTLSYMVCPNLPERVPLKVIDASRNSPLIEKVCFQTLRGGGYFQSMGNGFGYGEIDTTIDDIPIRDPKAWVARTRFPSRIPILDQVYSLIFHELGYLLGASHNNKWKDDFSSNLINDQYIRMATISLANRK